MKVIVAQIGARHRYAIPRMLARDGYLEALYTDSCTNCGAGRLLDAIVPQPARRGGVGKLLHRRIAGVPRERIRSTDRLLWQQLFRRPTRDTFAYIDRVGDAFSREMIRWGTNGASHVYSMFGEGIGFLRLAKERGLKVCVDVFITPIAHRIIAEERKRFPEWEGGAVPGDERLERRIREVIEVASVLLCPGANVVEGLNEFGNISADKVMVPYGSGTSFRGSLNKPIAGRILFAGTAELRKGIHYFAEAARRLASHRLTFVVAGNVTEQVRRLPACSALTFLGRISCAQMIAELLQADVLVLPTLAEGSASVIAEALSAGVPVITTRAAGSAVEHERSGLLVPERDPTALATSIERLVGDRKMRQVLADGAREASISLTEIAWAERLVRALMSPK